MTNNKRRLVARLVRLMNRVDWIRECHEQAFEYDRGFDGGEFCGPAHDRAMARECDQAAVRVGFASYAVAMDAWALVGRN